MPGVSMPFHDGDRVWLKEFREGVIHEPRQEGTVVGEYEPWSDTYRISIDKQYRLYAEDDGLREVPAWQVEGHDANT